MFKSIKLPEKPEHEDKTHVAKVFDSGQISETDIQKYSFDEQAEMSYRRQNRDSLKDDAARNAYAALYYEFYENDFNGLQEKIQNLNTKEVEEATLSYAEDILFREGVHETLRMFPQEELQPYFLKAIAKNTELSDVDISDDMLSGTVSYQGREYSFTTYQDPELDEITNTYAEDAALRIMKETRSEISYEEGSQYDLETKKLAELILKHSKIKSIEPDFGSLTSYDLYYRVSYSDKQFTESIHSADGLLLLANADLEEVLRQDDALMKVLPEISLSLLQEDLTILQQQKERTDRRSFINNWEDNIETLKEVFDDAYYESFSEVKDRLIDHFFNTDNWTNTQVEEITGKTLYDADSITPEDIGSEDIVKYTGEDGEFNWQAFEEDTGRISLNTWDSEYLDDMLRSSSDIDLDTMLQFAKSFGIELSGVEVPYKMIIFKDEILNENEADAEQIEAYFVCHNKEDLIEKWKEQLPLYEGCPYSIQSGDIGFHFNGTYEQNDLKTLEALPSYIGDYAFTCQVTGYLKLDMEPSADVDVYKEAMRNLWDSANLGDCHNADAEEVNPGTLKVTGSYEGTVQAYTLKGAIVRAEDSFVNADFEDLQDIVFEKLTVETVKEVSGQNEKQHTVPER